MTPITRKIFPKIPHTKIFSCFLALLLLLLMIYRHGPENYIKNIHKLTLIPSNYMCFFVFQCALILFLPSKTAYNVIIKGMTHSHMHKLQKHTEDNIFDVQIMLKHFSMGLILHLNLAILS